MRRSIPHRVEMDPTPPIGDDGCQEWHPEGDDFPVRWFGIMLIVGGVVALLLMLLLVFPHLMGEQQNPAYLPSPHGPPPSATMGQ